MHSCIVWLRLSTGEGVFRNLLSGTDRRRRRLFNEREWLNSDNKRLYAILDALYEVKGTVKYNQIPTEDSSGDAEDDQDPPEKWCGLTLRHIGVIFPARR